MLTYMGSFFPRILTHPKVQNFAHQASPTVGFESACEKNPAEATDPDLYLQTQGLGLAMGVEGFVFENGEWTSQNCGNLWQFYGGNLWTFWDFGALFGPIFRQPPGHCNSEILMNYWILQLTAAALEGLIFCHPFLKTLTLEAHLS